MSVRRATLSSTWTVISCAHGQPLSLVAQIARPAYGGNPFEQLAQTQLRLLFAATYVLFQRQEVRA